MHQQKGKKILIYFILFLIVGSINNTALNGNQFDNVKNIQISGLNKNQTLNLLKNIKKLNLKNIFILNGNEISKIISSSSLVENYEITKIYPNSLDIKIEKTNFLAKINDNGKIFLIGSNGKLTPIDSGYNELPYIFGKPSIDDFLKFKKKIDNSKFSYDQINNLFYFQSKRWDLKLHENILLKLPENLTLETLNSVYEFLENYNGKNFTILDARLENKFILNE